VSFKIRNTIVLAVLLLLVIIVAGYISFINQPGKIKKYRTEAKAIESQLQDNTAQMGAIAAMQGNLRETIHRWDNRTKEIGESDVSSQTYGYLSQIIDESGFLKLNMSFAGTKNGQGFGYNVYRLTGTSEFPNIFRFLWLLENGRKLYKIETISMRGDEIVKDSLEFPRIDITYEMEVHAYFTAEKTLGMPVAKPDSTPQPITSNPFMPSILRAPPLNVRHLINVETISVKAVAARKILVLEPSGRLVTIAIGDQVYLGRLSAIHPQTGEAEFTLNSGGIVKTVRKAIVFKK
jgi:hypothetical protein